jgi:hypothetical protein
MRVGAILNCSSSEALIGLHEDNGLLEQEYSLSNIIIRFKLDGIEFILEVTKNE